MNSREKLYSTAYAMVDYLNGNWHYEGDIFDDDSIEEGWLSIQADGSLVVGSNDSFSIPDEIVDLIEEDFMNYELN